MLIERGFQAKEVLELTGLSYRQLDHWARTEIITPSLTIKKGSRSIRGYSFEDLIAVRAALKLLELGLGFPAVKKVTVWLQEAFIEKPRGQFLFVIDGDNLSMLSSDPDEIIKIMRGKVAVSIDLDEVIEQLQKDIKALGLGDESSKGNGSGKRKSYAIPKIAIA